MNCEKKSIWCINNNVKLCQMKSKGGGKGGNVYEGKKIYMCSECRKFENGQFKIVREG